MIKDLSDSELIALSTEEANSELYERYKGLILNVFNRRFSGWNFSGAHSYQDVLQDAHIFWLESLSKYDKDRAKLSTFTFITILGFTSRYKKISTREQDHQELNDKILDFTVDTKSTGIDPLDKVSGNELYERLSESLEPLEKRILENWISGYTFRADPLASELNRCNMQHPREKLRAKAKEILSDYRIART